MISVQKIRMLYRRSKVLEEGRHGRDCLKTMGPDLSDVIYALLITMISLPVFIVTGYALFFKNWRDFGETLIALVKPGLVAACEGEWHEQVFRRIRFLWFAAACAIIMYHINMALHEHLKHFTDWCCSFLP